VCDALADRGTEARVFATGSVR